MGLLDDVLRLPDGLDTVLKPPGSQLVATHRQLLMLARAIAGRPRLLLVDGALDGLGDLQLPRACEALQNQDQPWTLLVATNRRDIAANFKRIIEVSPGSRPDDDMLAASVADSGGAV